MDKLLDENLIQIDYLRLLFGTIILLIEIIFIQYLYLKFSNSYNNKILKKLYSIWNFNSHNCNSY